MRKKILLIQFVVIFLGGSMMSCSNSKPSNPPMDQNEEEIIEEDEIDPDYVYIYSRSVKFGNLDDLINTQQFKEFIDNYVVEEALPFIKAYLSLPELTCYAKKANERQTAEPYTGSVYLYVQDKNQETYLKFSLDADGPDDVQFYFLDLQQRFAEGLRFFPVGDWKVKYFLDDFGQQGNRYITRSFGERNNKIGMWLSHFSCCFWGISAIDHNPELLLGDAELKIKYKDKISTFGGIIKDDKYFYPENMDKLISLLIQIDIENIRNNGDNNGSDAFISLICNSRHIDFHRRFTADAQDVNILRGFSRLYQGGWNKILNRMIATGESASEALIYNLDIEIKQEIKKVKEQRSATN